VNREFSPSPVAVLTSQAYGELKLAFNKLLLIKGESMETFGEYIQMGQKSIASKKNMKIIF